MKTLNNILVVHRNETFTLDKIVQNRDCSPYIVSAALENPYWLLTVSSTRYDQKDRYIQNWWLDLSDYPRFVFTNPIDLKSFKVSNEADAVSAFSSFSDVTSLSSFVGTYLNGQQITKMEANDFVYYLEDDNNNKEYKYWSTNINGWQKYECRIVKLFQQEITRQWVEQTYVYSITLMSGVSTYDYLKSLCDENNISYNNDATINDLYQALLDIGYEFDENFNINSPLALYTTVKPILVPTELRVMSDIKGGIYG